MLPSVHYYRHLVRGCTSVYGVDANEYRSCRVLAFNFFHVCNASCVDASRNYLIGRTHRGLCAHACTPIIRLTGLASRDSEGTHRGQYARRSRGRRAASTAATSHDHGGVSALCVPVHKVRADLQAPRDVLRRHGASAEADRCQGNTLGLNLL